MLRGAVIAIVTGCVAPAAVTPLDRHPERLARSPEPLQRHPAPIERDPEPIQDSIAAPIVVGPVTHAARDYNEPTAALSSTASNELFVGLRDFIHNVALTHDVRLDLASAAVADVVKRGGSPSTALIEFALRTHGIIEPAQRVAVVRGAVQEHLVADLTLQLAGTLHHSNTRIGFGSPTIQSSRSICTQPESCSHLFRGRPLRASRSRGRSTRSITICG